MKQNKLSNRLYVMQAYMTACTKGKIYPRYKSRAIITPHGFVPNFVWNSGQTAGSDRRAREIREMYSDFFEVITRSEYYDRYKPKAKKDFISNYSLCRIKPEKQAEWKKLVESELKK